MEGDSESTLAMDNATDAAPTGKGVYQKLSQVDRSDPAHPFHWSSTKKWTILTIYSLLQVFVSMTSTSFISVEYLIQEKFGGSTQVLTLGQSLFIVGNAVGPAFLGPLSDIAGRKWVYVVATGIYALLNIGLALAINVPMIIIFMFLAGASGSVALTNVGGTVADMWGSEDSAGQPMALFVVSATVGPSIGGPVGAWVAENVNMGLPWLFWMNVIIGGVFAVLLSFVPETLPQVVITRASSKKARTTKVLKEIGFITTMALRIMTTEPIVVFMGIYNGFGYGLLFLYLDGLFGVFVVNNKMSYIGADLTYLNSTAGVLVMFLFMPVQTYFYRRDRLRQPDQKGRPEARILTSLVTVWLYPASLFWFAFTSDGSTSFWSPTVAGAVLFFVDPLLYLGMLNYITDTYPHVAGSAVAAFLIPSFLVAAALAHLGIIMFDRMSTTWAMATLGFISLGFACIVYILYFFGHKIRKMSKLARD